MKMSKGRLIVFSAPSGCGKGTMLAEILKSGDFWLSVSATTRKPREGEVDGVNYHFLTDEKFEDMIKNDQFLEHAGYCGHYYGTPLKDVEEHLEKGVNVILEIEVQGAMNVMAKRPDALSIFVLPPSVNELRRRLKKRGTETDEVIEERVAQASAEIALAEKYDYVIMNDGLEEAVEDFMNVVKVEKFRSVYQSELIREVLENA